MVVMPPSEASFAESTLVAALHENNFLADGQSFDSRQMLAATPAEVNNNSESLQGFQGLDKEEEKDSVEEDATEIHNKK